VPLPFTANKPHVSLGESINIKETVKKNLDEKKNKRTIGKEKIIKITNVID